jgi:hypothetical protein
MKRKRRNSEQEHKKNTHNQKEAQPLEPSLSSINEKTPVRQSLEIKPGGAQLPLKFKSAYLFTSH